MFEVEFNTGICRSCCSHIWYESVSFGCFTCGYTVTEVNSDD